MINSDSKVITTKEGCVKIKYAFIEACEFLLYPDRSKSIKKCLLDFNFFSVDTFEIPNQTGLEAALIRSLKWMGNVALLMLFVFLLFGLVGITDFHFSNFEK